jgi:predicted DCC family thiol-disulfide oxidoreductase YuxK
MYQNDVIIFDGVCNFCNSWVLWLIKRDRKSRYLFSASQMDSVKKVIDNSNPVAESILLVRNGKTFVKSTAVLKILQGLGGIYRAAAVFYIIPEKIRDYIYDFIAGRRYKWFGKRPSCMVPDDKIRARFMK